MTVRQTSITAYNSLQQAGVLSAVRWQVYNDVFHNGPTTSGEFFARLVQTTAVPRQQRARFTELRNMGLLSEVGVRPCSVTGHSAIEWDVTLRVVPLSLPKRKSTKTQLTEATQRIADLEQAIEDLSEGKVGHCPGCAIASRAKVLGSVALDALVKGKSIKCRDCGLRMSVET